MPKILRLPESLRVLLKKPLGALVTEDVLKEEIQKQKPRTIIAVGDGVTRTLMRLEIPANLYIIDGKIQRENVVSLRPTTRIMTLENPAGTLNLQAFNLIQEALKDPPVTLKVEGEEDLLTLVAISKGPNGSIVIYGQPPINQPNEGVVLVKVNSEKKKFVRNIIERMDVVS